MPVPAGEFLVGRADNAYVHVDDPSVSRNHARLLNNQEGFFIEDLNSSNGTAFRGAFIAARTKIDFGNIVHIGSVPFRVDPEVTGEVEIHPPPSSRNVSAASMRRATERIPSIGEAPWVPEAVPPDRLSAPEISPADSDAEDLNAVTFRDPEPVAPVIPHHPQPASSPAPPANLTSVQKAAFVSTPTPQRSISPQQMALQQALLEAEGKGADLRKSALPSALDNPDPRENGPPEKGAGRIWYLVTFFAGLGTGLLIGLNFAKIFFEMGGKPTGLP
ncbi:MAG: FHA domain-containing protein [Methylacidiphilales bacterium]|nr:FHA domain-containing protein [Candidatus Methylacidiphilales bacterium]